MYAHNLTVPIGIRETLRRMQGIWPVSIIGGGFLRDIDNGVEPRDIDIFVQVPASASPGRFEERLQQLFPSFHVLDRTNEADDYDRSVIKQIFELRCEGFKMINVMVFHGMLSLEHFCAYQLQRFDIGLCCIVFDGKTVWIENAYQLDKEDHTLTILHDRTLEASRLRARRILQRYPGWQIVDPYLVP